MTRSNANRNDSLVKIRVPLPEEDRAEGVEAENLWAEAIGQNRFRIDNIPFYAYGISAEDIVCAVEVDERIEFREVIARSGHSTYRVWVNDPAGYESSPFQQFWKRLQELGCGFEVAKRQWIAIDVPPDSDVFAVCKVLEEGKEKGTWWFEEAHCGIPRVEAD
jgi:hypothetical protein